MSPGRKPFPAKFPVQLTTEDNDKIYIIAARQGISPGRWARSVLHEAIERALQQDIQQEKSLES